MIYNILILLFFLQIQVSPTMFRDHKNVMSLGLKQAVKQAVSKNKTLKKYLYTYLSSKKIYEAATGRWDPVFGANMNFMKAHYPAVEGQPFQTTKSLVAVGSLFLKKPLSSGGALTLSTSLSRNDQTMHLQFSNTMPASDKDIKSYKFMVNLTIEHSFLQGWKDKSSKVDIEKARLKMLGDQFVYFAQAQGIIRDVIKAYWNLVLAWKAWEIQKISLEVLRNQEKLTKSLVMVEKVPKINLLAVESEIAKREGEIRKAWSGIVAASLNLKYMLGMSVTSVPIVIKPTTKPVLGNFIAPRDFLKLIVKRSNQLKSLIKQVASMKQELIKAADALLPSLDVKFRIGPAMSSSKFSDTITGVITKMDEAYEVEGGANFLKPITKSFKNRYESIKYLTNSLKLQQKDLKARLLMSGLIALDSLDSSKFRINASKKAVALAKLHLDAEKKRFKQGLSTNHSVLLRLQELEIAEFQLAQSLIEAVKTKVDINTLAGKLLQSYEILLPRSD